MLEWVQDIAESSGYSYGSRRMKKALNALGFPVSRNKARKLMREAGVQVRHRKKYKVTTNSNHKLLMITTMEPFRDRLNGATPGSP
jgi:transposase InsO family protein